MFESLIQEIIKEARAALPNGAFFIVPKNGSYVIISEQTNHLSDEERSQRYQNISSMHEFLWEEKVEPFLKRTYNFTKEEIATLKRNSPDYAYPFLRGFINPDYDFENYGFEQAAELGKFHKIVVDGNPEILRFKNDLIAAFNLYPFMPDKVEFEVEEHHYPIDPELALKFKNLIQKK